MQLEDTKLELQWRVQPAVATAQSNVRTSGPARLGNGDEGRRVDEIEALGVRISAASERLGARPALRACVA